MRRWRWLVTSCALGLGGCPSSNGPDYDVYCGTTTWKYANGTSPDKVPLVSEQGCFEVADNGFKVRAPVPGGGDCELTGHMPGSEILLTGGTCVLPSVVPPAETRELFTRWYVRSGDAFEHEGRWIYMATADIVAIVHDGTYGPDLDVANFEGEIILSGTGPGGVGADEYAWDNSFGHPCEPSGVYGASITGRVAQAIGSMESCEQLLLQLGTSATYDYTFLGDGHYITYGEDPILYTVFPDRCVVVFDQNANLVKSRLDLDARTVTITRRANGPLTPTGAGMCVLEWTGSLTPK